MSLSRTGFCHWKLYLTAMNELLIDKRRYLLIVVNLGIFEIQVFREMETRGFFTEEENACGWEFKKQLHVIILLVRKEKMMETLATTRMSSKGQVVIPE